MYNGGIWMKEKINKKTINLILTIVTLLLSYGIGYSHPLFLIVYGAVICAIIYNKNRYSWLLLVPMITCALMFLTNVLYEVMVVDFYISQSIMTPVMWISFFMELIYLWQCSYLQTKENKKGGVINECNIKS